MNIDVSGMIESPWLKGADIPAGRKTVATISEVGRQTFNGESKIVLSFENSDKRLICNKTQLRALAALFGEQTGTWQGQRIQLSSKPSGYQDTMTIAIAAAPVVAPGLPEPIVELDDDDEEIPF